MTNPDEHVALHLPPEETDAAAGLQWHRPGEPEGKAWPLTDTPLSYDRLPARAEGLVPDPVWDLSRHPSGMFHRFRTDARSIWARWTVRKAELGMWHMPPTSVSGIDLYGRDDSGRLRWVGISHPGQDRTNETPMVEGLDGRMREYVAYLPLFNPLDKIEIGVDANASFTVLDPAPERPIVYYGTSIVHGAAASRPGMSLPAQLGRRLDRTVIGLGFSGRGKMERELAELLGELDAAAFIVDCLPNMTADLVDERAHTFCTTLRRLRPDVPLLLVEDRTHCSAWAVPERQERSRGSRAALRRAYIELADPAVHYLCGEQLLGDDGEGTVDGSHPTDLGFTRMTEQLTPILRELLDSR